MITINRIRQRMRQARHARQSRRLIAQANRLQARALRKANPGYDELRSPLFKGVMALATLVLVVDVSDSWARLDSVFEVLASIATHIARG